MISKDRHNLRSISRMAMLLLIGCVMMMAPQEVSSQTHYSGNVAFGVKGGADLSQVMFTPSVKQSFKPGAYAGVTFRYIEENHFGVIAELNFIQRGWKENFEGKPFEYSRTLNYIELPAMTHIYFGRRGRFFFNAGPVISYMLGDKISSNFNPYDWKHAEGFPDKNRTNDQISMAIANRFDYGICAGLGGEFNINKRNSICLEARFYFGLGNIMSAKRADVFSGSNNMTLSFGAGYWFRIK